MSKIEILAPAGGFDSVIAAVRSGADAVYVGAERFSARAGAHNFDDGALRDCVRYCHQRGVKVHLALNTLVFDDEIKDALDLAETAARADIDAIILQDMGLATLIHRAIPDLPLHASTQMSVHTPYGARALYELGFTRAVPSRELSMGEIREIRDFCPEIELEVFVHGALCMCVSGQCYFSAMLGGRSANRGMCAQPCRLPMQFGGSDHALSLKDNGSLGYLRQLQELGVVSAKIEGRMKRPEYVAAATRAAVEARDTGRVSRESEERLRSVFSRTGFTDGYLAGKLGEEMFGYRQKSDVLSADSKLLRELRATYKDECCRVAVDFTFTAHAGQKPRLQATDGSHTVVVEGESPIETAINLPLTADRAIQSLRKTGSTPYRADTINTDISPDVSVPLSAINALRREALDRLGELRGRWHDYQINDIDITLPPVTAERNAPGDWACVHTLDFPDTIGEIASIIFADIYALDDDKKRKEKTEKGLRLGVEVPRATFGNEGEVYKRLERLRAAGVRDLLAHNIAAVYMGRALGYTVHAGFGLNITNSHTLKWAAAYGIADAELSPEIDIKRIEKLTKPIPVGIIRYGHLPLMVSRNAPAGRNETCKNGEFLQDRRGEKFPVERREGYSEIYNCVPILMPQKDYNLGERVFGVFRFSVEKSVENMEKTLEKLRENRDFERKTHGLYLRGVKNFTIF